MLGLTLPAVKNYITDSFIMENPAKKDGSKWLYFDLTNSLKNAKSRKKVLIIDQFRSALMLEAIRAEAMSETPDFSAGFSYIKIANTDSMSTRSITEQVNIAGRQQQHYSKAPEWKFIKPELEAILYQLAMQEASLNSEGTLIHTSFTLDLTPEFTHKASHHKAGFIDYTKREIDKAFKSELSRTPQYWFTFELAKLYPEQSHTRGYLRPHLHGSLLLTPAEMESVRHQKTLISKAFHKAVGKCSPGFSNRLLSVKSHNAYAHSKNITSLAAAVGWVDYCYGLGKTNGKTPAMARLFFNNKNLIADNQTKRQAKAIYDLLSQNPAEP
jgi:hypothetical protein